MVVVRFHVCFTPLIRRQLINAPAMRLRPWCAPLPCGILKAIVTRRCHGFKISEWTSTAHQCPLLFCSFCQSTASNHPSLLGIEAGVRHALAGRLELHVPLSATFTHRHSVNQPLLKLLKSGNRYNTPIHRFHSRKVVLSAPTVLQAKSLTTITEPTTIGIAHPT